MQKGNSSQQTDRHRSRPHVCSFVILFFGFLFVFLMQKRAPPTLQFVLVLDVQLLADQGVPQAQGAVEHLGAGGVDEGDSGHVGGLGGMQARHGAWLVALALAGREVD